MKPLVPVAVLALSTLWAGTLWGQALAVGAFACSLAALALVVLLVEEGSGGLARERVALVLLATLAALALASYFLSPVREGSSPRAALWLGLAAPPWLGAALWREPEARRHALLGLDLLVLVAALWAFLDLVRAGGGRAALPLGHHNLLAVWLVATLPFPGVAALEERGARRGVALAAFAAGLASLLATRSLGGFLALLVQGAVAGAIYPRRRWWLAGGAALAFAAAGPRLLAIVAGGDSSLAARRVYWEAGFRGIFERPWLGWGPGSVPLTLGLHLEPVPGVNPPLEVVGELHNLPLELAYELGLPALVVVLALGAFVVHKAWQGQRRLGQGGLARAALLGLAGAGVTALTVAWTAIPALAAAVALAAGAGLAAAANPPLPGAQSRRLAPVIVTCLLLVPLLGLEARHVLVGRHFEAALRAPSRVQMCADLARAFELAPRDPLVAARSSWCETGRWGANLALGGAESAPGVAMFWLVAGVRWSEVDAVQAQVALHHALSLAPLAGEAAYSLALLEPDDAAAAPCLARAVLGEPRLAAAMDLAARPGLLALARQQVLAWDGIEPGWREAMAEVLTLGPDPAAEVARFGIGRESAEGGLSLWAFRRRPWPAEWFSIPVDRARFDEITIPAASALPSSAREAFPRERCGLKVSF